MSEEAAPSDVPRKPLSLNFGLMVEEVGGWRKVVEKPVPGTSLTVSKGSLSWRKSKSLRGFKLPKVAQ